MKCEMQILRFYFVGQFAPRVNPRGLQLILMSNHKIISLWTKRLFFNDTG